MFSLFAIEETLDPVSLQPRSFSAVKSIVVEPFLGGNSSWNGKKYDKILLLSRKISEGIEIIVLLLRKCSVHQVLTIPNWTENALAAKVILSGKRIYDRVLSRSYLFLVEHFLDGNGTELCLLNLLLLSSQKYSVCNFLYRVFSRYLIFLLRPFSTVNNIAHNYLLCRENPR